MSDGRPTRRRVLALSGSAFATGLAGCLEGYGPSGLAGQGPDGPTTHTSTADLEPTRLETVGLETTVEGVEAPLGMTFVPDEDLRYVASQTGLIHVHGPDGLRDDPLLDLRSSIETGYEMGVLGVALHPEFANSRRLFVRYSSPPREETPDDYNHTSVLAEFEVNEAGTQADPESERAVLEIPQPQGNHNSGSIAFGPDGYLYVGTGDGGNRNDTGLGHPEDWYEVNEGGNGQDTTENLLGGILRIDVDDGDGDLGYAIPEDNPLVDEEGHRDEYYAWGLRNPWGMSFDDDRYFVADVGQARWEEINLVERGGNYGWNVKEGTTCFDASDMNAVPDQCPDETPPDVRGGERLIDPVVEYSNEGPTEGELDGAAVVGGHVYRGSALPDLDGAYVFGDLEPAGRLFLGTPPDDDTDSWSASILELDDESADALERILAFERDDAGEVYVLGGGAVHRIVPAE